jgi:site-specific DNA recombinase
MVNRNKIEAAVLDGLREVLKNPGYLETYFHAYNEERTRLARDGVRDRAKLERRLGEIKRESDRLVDAIAEGAPADAIAPKLKALEAEKAGIVEQLAAANENRKAITIHPAAIKNYLKDVAAMREALDDEGAAERPELIAPLRRLIHSVIVHAQPGVKGAFDVEIKGRLQELLGAPFLRRSVGGGLVVAGERFVRSPPSIQASSPSAAPLAKASRQFKVGGAMPTTTLVLRQLAAGP